MEYLQLFDKDKNKLEEKLDRESKNNLSGDKYYMVVLVFIENEEGKFLFQKTSKSRNSCIAITGGHVSYGDDAIYTAIKEVKEELGIEILQEELNYVDTIINNNCYFETFYLKKNIDIKKIEVQVEEVEYVKWYSIDEINNFIASREFRESHIIPLKKILNYIDRINNY